MSIGQCYFVGTGVPKDLTKATAWLEAALAADADFSRPVPPTDFLVSQRAASPAGTAEAVAGEVDRDPIAETRATAHFLLGQIDTQEKKLEEAQVHLVAAAAAGPNGREGIYQAAVQAAFNYAFGNGTPRDLTKANEMLDQARKLGTRLGANIIHNYAMLKMVDEFATGDLEESVEKAGAAAETDIQFKIAKAFEDKSSKEYNPAEAVKWYELAAESGRPWAMLSLAFIYVRGDLGKPDYAKAVEFFQKAAPVHYLAAANLGIAYENGLGVPRDHAQAQKIFKQHEADDILCYLGTLGKAPATFQTYEQALKTNVYWAKEIKDPRAQCILGIRYVRGWGVTIDIGEAADWLKRSAKGGYPPAMCDLANLYRAHARELAVNWSDVVEWDKKGVEAGNVGAMVNYAYLYLDGWGVGRDLAKAAQLYEGALKIEPNNGLAHTNLAAIYSEYVNDAVAKKDNAREKECRERMLAELAEGDKDGNGFAELSLGDYYCTLFHRTMDLQSVKDDRLAYQYYQKAADHGNVESHLWLGKMHEQGLGVPITYDEAAYHYRIAALEGNMEALRLIVDLYLTGRLGEVDLTRAAFWLDQMYRRGEIGSLIPLADIMLKNGQAANAVKLLEKLSELNQRAISGYAYERLSTIYMDGTGVPVDERKAKKYFNSAVYLENPDALTRLAERQLKEHDVKGALINLGKANEASPKASYDLGQLYFLGKDVPRDEAKSVKLMKSAADSDYLPALYFLAVLTFNKDPMAPGLDEAIGYAQRAESGGLKAAAKVRELLEKRRDAADKSPAA